MELTLFEKLINDIPDSVKRIFFGGIGEPLFHPDIIYMIKRAKETGRNVELITNGTLLDGFMSDKIIEAGLDMIWVSLDSVEEKTCKNIHFESEFNGVMGNIQIFNKKRMLPYWDYTRIDLAKVKLGVAFVLMKNNLSQFLMLLKKAYSLGISEVKATHLIPYDKSQIDQICYDRILGIGFYDKSQRGNVLVNMPLMDTLDVNEYDMLSLYSYPGLSFIFMGMPLQRRTDYCRFVQEGVTFVRWDGEVCPCMALLHENTVYQQNKQRFVKPCGFGNLNKQSLAKVWQTEAYAAFRQQVINFEFSICTHCGPCELFESNEADCFGNTFPTCGACLWAQGFFQCP
jgi:MoaA/NifB/PqqE/SkfB family radical SAM enzyme